MRRRQSILPKILFLAILTLGLLSSTDTNAEDEASRLSCVRCSTDERALPEKRSKEKPKKSTHTSDTD